LWYDDLGPLGQRTLDFVVENLAVPDAIGLLPGIATGLGFLLPLVELGVVMPSRCAAHQDKRQNQAETEPSHRSPSITIRSTFDARTRTLVNKPYVAQAYDDDGNLLQGLKMPEDCPARTVEHGPTQ
jgi:hypothetical protein